jgi:glycosyltransferase involved in cell wall biosynthesis
MTTPFVLIDTLSSIDHEQIRGRAVGASEYQFYRLVAEMGSSCYNSGSGPRQVGNIIYDNIGNAVIPEGAIVLLMRSYPYVVRDLVAKLAGHVIVHWVHDTPGDHLVDRTRTDVAAAKAEVLANPNHYFVANSQTCRRQLIEYFGPTIEGRVFVIPNALYTDEFATDLPTTVDNNRIVYASAWVKGIEGVITAFDYVFRHDPDFRLTLMNPGYDNMDRYKGLIADIQRKYRGRVEILGAQSRAEFSRVVAGSLCTMTARFSETFGCVFAESLALGTPVIADVHSGAVHEFVGFESIVDYGAPETVLTRLRALRSDRRCPSLPMEYRAEPVMQQWRDLLAKLGTSK